MDDAITQPATDTGTQGDPAATAQADPAAAAGVGSAATPAAAQNEELKQQFAQGDPANDQAQRLDALTAENEQLRSDLDAANKRAEDAETKLKAKPARVTEKDSTSKARKFKALKAPTGDKGEELEDAAKRDQLREQLRDAEDVEIVLVDDKLREIPGAKPISIEGNVWKDHGLGLMLAEPVDIQGPSDGVGYSIAGYALVIDGKHVRTMMRPEPVNVAPGSKIKLVDDIAF